MTMMMIMMYDERERSMMMREMMREREV